MSLIVRIFVTPTTSFRSHRSEKSSVLISNYLLLSVFLGLGKVTITELEPAVAFCDVLVYGYAGIDANTNKVVALNSTIDLDGGHGLYRQLTNLKQKYPKLKVLLGVGGNADPNNEIYLQLLENPQAYAIFINSAYTLVKTYNFDGLDLAWQFKPNKPKRIRSGVGSFWYSAKKTFGLAGNIHYKLINICISMGNNSIRAYDSFR